MQLAKIITMAIVATTLPLLAGAAVGAPLSASMGLKAADVAVTAETVQYRRGFRNTRGWRGGGAGLGIGIGAGLLLGGALAARPYYYDSYDDGNRYYGSRSRSYDDGSYVAVDRGGYDDVAYCQQTFRSYDVRSGTYLGYDGYRHSCP
jgi:hypothetical protein